MRMNKLEVIILIIALCLMISGYKKSDIVDNPEDLSTSRTIAMSPSVTQTITPTNTPTITPEEVPIVTPIILPTLTPEVIDAFSKKIMSYSYKPLTNQDFEVNYQNYLINSKTDSSILDSLGIPDGYDDNNGGLISESESLRRWRLCYPDYSNVEIELMFLSSKDEDENSIDYIVGVDLQYYKTYRGLQVGDDVDKVLKLYGRPETFDNINLLTYQKDNLNLEIALNEDLTKINDIFINYNMDKSIKD